MNGLGVRRLRALIVGLPPASSLATSGTGWSPELELSAAAVEGLDRVLLALGGRKGKPLRIPRPALEVAKPAARRHAETPDEVIAAVSAALTPKGV